MKTILLITEDGDEGTLISNTIPQEGETVTVQVTDLDGKTFQVESTVAAIIDVKDTK